MITSRLHIEPRIWQKSQYPWFRFSRDFSTVDRFQSWLVGVANLCLHLCFTK